MIEEYTIYPYIVTKELTVSVILGAVDSHINIKLSPTAEACYVCCCLFENVIVNCIGTKMDFLDQVPLKGLSEEAPLMEIIIISRSRTIKNHTSLIVSLSTDTKDIEV